jgi:aspartate/methionine/tyrosine aminotransferase
VFGTLPVNQRAVDAVAGVATSSQGNGYSHSSGMEECRQAVADHHSTPLSRVPAHHVFMTSGCSQALEVRRSCATAMRNETSPSLASGVTSKPPAQNVVLSTP